MTRMRTSSNDKVHLAIVIVNYKTADLVTQCINSLLDQIDSERFRVIVVDNCSPDESATIIQNWITAHNVGKLVHLIVAQANAGFSAGNNIGIRAVVADWYLLLNSDTYVRPEAISTLIKAACRHREAGLISPRLEWPDATPQDSCFRYLSPITEFISAAQTGPVTALLKRFDIPWPMHGSIVRPNWTSFAGVLIRGEVLRGVGLMDEGFFMYFEDVEFCHRAWKAGWQIVHEAKARVVHLRGGSSPVKRQVLERKRLPRYYYASRTRWLYLGYGWLGLTLANVLWSLGRCLSKCREVLEGRNRGVPDKQWRDIWINWLHPDAPWSEQSKR